MTAKRSKYAKKYEICGTLRSQILIFLIFLVLFSKSLVEKVVIDEEELDRIDIDSILNLENLSRTVFVN